MILLKYHKGGVSDALTKISRKILVITYFSKQKEKKPSENKRKGELKDEEKN